jgi:flavin-binding protein dodecin
LIFGSIVLTVAAPPRQFRRGQAVSAAIEDRLRAVLRVCRREGCGMSVYRVIDVIGTSSESWEDAAATAIKTASQSVRDLRVGEVVEQDIHVADDGGLVYRTKLRLSFKYESQ